MNNEIFSINVGPTFINFGFFPGPTALLKALHFFDLENFEGKKIKKLLQCLD